MRHIYFNYTRQVKNTVLLIALLLITPCAVAQNGTWTWMNGDSTAYGATVTGTQGVPDSLNTPGGLYESARWKDLDGNLWIFGGVMGDYEWGAMWKFDPATSMWTWMHGIPNINVFGIYGAQGVPAPGNRPGSRGWGSAAWTDQNGDLWMFGGWGSDVNGQVGPLADLWRYHIATNEWTWMSGSQNVYSFGSYGTIQVPSATNAPPCRQECIANWVDNSGNLWFYGGILESGGNIFADMWKYDVTTNMWTWMSGGYSGGVNYGVQQVAAASNSPGGRGSASAWTDSQGNFWMYGGTMFSSLDFGDMWKYDPTTNWWTWMAGTSGYNPPCTFTTPNVAGNGVPGARFEGKSTWIDACDRMWCYGGFYFPGSVLTWDQLWMFDPSTNLFTWIDGANTWNPSAGMHNTYQIPSATNYPASLGGAASFTDDSGDVWMFGGWTMTTPQGGINTLWRYEPVLDSCLTTSTVYHGTDNNFLVYPNPAQGTMHIQLSDRVLLDGMTIQIYDATGRCVQALSNFESRQIAIHLESSGLYFISITAHNGESIGTTRIINTK